MALGKTIREFGVKLSLGYDKAAFDKAGRSLDTITGTLSKIGLGAAAAAGTMFGFAEATASNAKQLELYETTLGINAERLQELSFAAKSAANVSREQLVGALEGVSKTLDDVRKGNVDAAFTFQRLGLSQDVLANRSLKSDQVMMMVADRLKEIQDPIARASIATQIFGSAGAELLPLLLKGSKGIAELGTRARQLGIIIDNKTLKSQAKFQDSLNEVMAVIQNISYLIGGKLIKVLTPLVHEFERYVVQNKQLIATGIADFIKGLGVGLKYLFQFSVAAAEGLKKIIDALGGVENATKIVLGLFAAFTAGKLLVAIVTIAQAFATLSTALIAIAPVAAVIGGVVLGIQALWKVLHGQKFEDTWLGQLMAGASKLLDSLGILKDLMDLKKEAESGVGNAISSIKGFLGFKSAASAGTAGGSSSNTNNQNQFHTQVTVQVPPGTSAGQATGIVSDGVNDGIHTMLRQTRNQAVGGVAY